MNRRIYGDDNSNFPELVQRGDGRAARGGRGAQGARGGYTGARGGKRAKPVIQADGTFAFPVLQERRIEKISPISARTRSRAKSPPPKADRLENRFAQDRRNKKAAQEDEEGFTIVRARAGNVQRGAARPRGGPAFNRPAPTAAPVFNLLNNDDFMARIREEEEARKAAAAAVATVANTIQPGPPNTGVEAPKDTPPAPKHTVEIQAPKPAEFGMMVSNHAPKTTGHTEHIQEAKQVKTGMEASMYASPVKTTPTKAQMPKPVDSDTMTSRYAPQTRRHETSPARTTVTEDQTPKPAKMGMTISDHEPEAIVHVKECQEPNPHLEKGPFKYASPAKTTATSEDQTPKPVKVGRTIPSHTSQMNSHSNEVQEPGSINTGVAFRDDLEVSGNDVPVIAPQAVARKGLFEWYDPERIIALGANQRPADGLSELYIHPDELPSGGVTVSEIVDRRNNKGRKAEVDNIIALFDALESESQSETQSEKPRSYAKPRMTPDPEGEIVWHKVQKVPSASSKASKKGELLPRSKDLPVSVASPHLDYLAEPAPGVKPPTKNDMEDDFDDFLSQASAAVSLPKAKRPSEILEEELAGLSFEEAKVEYKQSNQPQLRANAVPIVPPSTDWEEAEKKRKAAKKNVAGIEASIFAQHLSEKERQREEAMIAPTRHLFKNYNQRKKIDYTLPSWLAKEVDELIPAKVHKTQK